MTAVDPNRPLSSSPAETGGNHVLVFVLVRAIQPMVSWSEHFGTLMKYYVRKDASSDLEGPFDVEAIRGWVAGGRFTTDFEAIEDLGRTTDQLRRSRRWQTLEELFAEPAAVQAEQTPKAFLEKVRDQSCYKTLRLCVDLVMLAAWFASAFGIYFYSPVRESTLEFLAIGFGILFLAAVLAIAFRQSAFVLIDVADILIEQNRRKPADW